MLFVPTPSGNAQFSVFDALLGTIGGMSASLTQMQQIGQSTALFEQETLWPVSIIGQFQSVFTGLTSYGQAALSAISSVPVQSATLPSSMALESQILSGSQSLVNTYYTNTYGPNLTVAQAPAPVVQSIGMADATAMDSMQLGMSADATTSTLINQAQQIQTTASSVAAGVQDIMTAQAMAGELEVLAQQHRMYAAMLREEANDLAVTGMEYKQTATAVQNTDQGVQNVVGNGGNPQ
ncbi:MAG: hypothetical protein ACP5EP_09620 [Acidobacteriaceae bacterium]